MRLSRSMVRRSVLCLLVILATGVAGARAAQDPLDPPSRQEFESMMEAYVISKLQEALDLTDEQFGQMVVAQKKLQDTRRAYRNDRRELLFGLRQTLRREDSGEEAIRPTLRKLEARKQAFLEEERERYQDIDRILDVRQQARYRLLEAELENRLRELVRQVRERNRPR